jgi:hypothetical protein
VLLEVLLGGGDELDGRKLEAAVLEARDDGANEATLCGVSRALGAGGSIALGTAMETARGGTHLDAVGLDGNEAGAC